MAVVAVRRRGWGRICRIAPARAGGICVGEASADQKQNKSETPALCVSADERAEPSVLGLLEISGHEMLAYHADPRKTDV